MKVLWLTWKDRQHPAAGGAETVSGEIMDRLVLAGHEVKVITAQYKNSLKEERVNNIDIYRTGGTYTVYLKARKVVKKQLDGWADVIIDEMNTIPFGVAFYTNTPSILLTYQLAREVWLYQMPFPISIIGYASEIPMLSVLSKKYKLTVTESDSTKKDLEKHGFKNVHIFRVGTPIKPVEQLSDKENSSIILSLGAIRPMKRTLDAVKAFEFARDINPGLIMKIAGDSGGKYAEKVITYIHNSRHKEAISVLGRVSAEEKVHLMQEAMLILVTSIKEGWGLIVTEAASQGTPAVVYDTDGLRDSVKNGVTGLVSKNSDPKSMAIHINELLNDNAKYIALRRNAWEWSKEFTFENSYKDFFKLIK